MAEKQHKIGFFHDEQDNKNSVWLNVLKYLIYRNFAWWNEIPKMQMFVEYHSVHLIYYNLSSF